MDYWETNVFSILQLLLTHIRSRSKSSFKKRFPKIDFFNRFNPSRLFLVIWKTRLYSHVNCSSSQGDFVLQRNIVSPMEQQLIDYGHIDKDILITSGMHLENYWIYQYFLPSYSGSHDSRQTKG